MHYTVTNNNNTYLDIANEYNEILGTLEYTFWQPKRAHITLANNVVYNIDPVGFWLGTMEVTKDGEECAIIKYNWPGSHLVLSFASGVSLTFMRKNIFNSTYIATDAAGNEIALIQTIFTWKFIGFNYEIDIQDNCADEETMSLLPFILAYCASHIRKSHYLGTV